MASDSDSDEDDFVQYGTPLEPLDEDNAFQQRGVRQQTVRDKYGRQRFHGAFTGGFSAGFFNSVGSLEGWTPSSFKSSRLEKGEKRKYGPEDFMDEEDFSEFGIAPKKLRPTGDFLDSFSGKDRGNSFSRSSAIPGEPVLKNLITSVKETVGIALLRKMGWRPGQGVGPRLTRQEKKARSKKQNKESDGVKIYGCSLPSTEVDSDESFSDSEVTFAPDDVMAFECSPKNDNFGIGYKGLDRTSLSSHHINLFEPSSLVIEGKKNSKGKIMGQAFGVGALEDDDEDIYHNEDMSQYDFSLQTTKEKEQGKPSRFSNNSSNFVGEILLGFHIAAQPVCRKRYVCPAPPSNFEPVHKGRGSKFESSSLETSGGVSRKKCLDRHALDAKGRAQILSGSVQEESKDSTKENLNVQQETLTEWEKEHKSIGSENTGSSFSIHQFMAGEIESRFVHESGPDTQVETPNVSDSGTDQKMAAKMKMFGKLTREISEWCPSDSLCKRFNVPNPRKGIPSHSKRKTEVKHTIFDFLAASSYNKVFQPSQETDPSEEIVVEGLSQPGNCVNEKEQVTVRIKVEEMEDKEKQPSYEEQDVLAFPDPPKKIDLFKAIFLSSGESESSEDESSSEENRELGKTGDSVIDDNRDVNRQSNAGNKENAPKLGNEVNVERNTSPPRGLFANIDLDALSARTQKSTKTEVPVVSSESQQVNTSQTAPIPGSRVQSEPSNTIQSDYDVYGPSLPPGATAVKDTTSPTAVPVISRIPVVDLVNRGKWVEKTRKSSKSKHKKSKKKRKSKKKHKHKHSKRKISDSESSSYSSD